MAGYNKIMLVGRLGDDPIKTTFGENKICVKFSLATSKKFKNDKNELIERTQWHRCVSFGKTAEIMEKYTKKGDMCMIEGELRYSSWEDEKGIKRYSSDIYTNTVILTGNK